MTLALVRPTQLYIWKGPSLLLVDEQGESGERDQLALRATLLDRHAVAFTDTHLELTQFGGGAAPPSGN